MSIAELPMKLKPRNLEKFPECRLTDVGESVLSAADRWKKTETCNNALR